MNSSRVRLLRPEAPVLAGKRVLMLAPVSGYGGFNTSVHRMQALRALGGEVTVLDSCASPTRCVSAWAGRLRSRLFRHGLPVRQADPGGDNARLAQAAAASRWDLIWLEKGLTIGPQTLRSLRASSPTALILGFSPDDMYARHNQSLQFLDSLTLYDAFLTTKSYNVGELARMGCPRVVFVGNGYEPEAFRPISVDHEEQKRLGGDIGFIGSFEAERAQTMRDLARAGFALRVWGNGWEHLQGVEPGLTIEGKPLQGDDFARACSAFKINLGFLRKLNRDQQTTRSVEIPACGGFMLAERTTEHRELFIEGEEAEFFDSFAELAGKCTDYLANPERRDAIARRGHARCMSGGYSNAARLGVALRALLRPSPDKETADGS